MKLNFRYFMDVTDCKRIVKFNEAKKAVALGHDIRARCLEFQTDTIVKFVDDNTVETRFGDIYQLN